MKEFNKSMCRKKAKKLYIIANFGDDEENWRKLMKIKDKIIHD
jgi:hypothetical protein